MQKPREHYWLKLKTIYNAMLKPERWYTGLSIKQYLRQRVFNLQQPEFSNKPISSGRWSAYAHYSSVRALDNLLDKHEIDHTKTVLVHPLLPPSMVDLILARGAKITTLDIQKSTLSFNSSELVNYVRLMKTTGLPDLIVHYDLSGVLNEVILAIKETQKMSVPSLVYLDSSLIHAEFLNLCENLELGSVLWNAGQSFLDEQLDTSLSTTLESKPWYISWFIETRAKAILEYHLSASQDVFTPLLEAYFYLLLKKYESMDLRGALFYTPLVNRFLLKKPFKNRQEAERQVMENYELLQDSAISDVVFDLQAKSEEPFEQIQIQDIYNRELIWRRKSKDLYDFWVSKISSQSPGTLEIPDFFVDRTYAWQYVYVTQPDVWLEYFSKRGWIVDVTPPMHENFRSRPNLKNAQLASTYGFGLSILNGLDKSF